MDLATNLVFLVIFGLVGFATEKIFGFNVYKIFSDLSIVMVLLAIVIFVLPVATNPNSSLTAVENILTFFVNILPGAIIGDLAGSFVAAITGEKV